MPLLQAIPDKGRGPIEQVQFLPLARKENAFAIQHEHYNIIGYLQGMIHRTIDPI
jgi:hypothetical protein